MKNLKSFMCGLCALIMGSFATPVIAGSSDFAGPYIAIQGSVNGGALEGTATNSNNEITSGSIGKVFGGVGLQVGWAVPVADSFLIGLDLQLNPGDGKMSLDSGQGDSEGNNEDITVEFGDIKRASITPMVSVSDSSAVYIKYGITLADLTWTGDVDTSLNSSMHGETIAVGSRTMYGTGMFIQTEAGVTDWDNLNVLVDSGGTADASPKSVYGAVSVGFRF